MIFINKKDPAKFILYIQGHSFPIHSICCINRSPHAKIGSPQKTQNAI